MGWKDRDWSRGDATPGAPPGRPGHAQATIALVVVTVLCYFTQLFLLHWAKWDPIARGLGCVPADVLGRLHLWQLVTALFLHSPSDAWHVAANMLFLAMFGPMAEQRVGRAAFLRLYLLAGIVGNLAYAGVGMATEPRIPAIGASGAVMGVMVYATLTHPWEVVSFLFLFPMKAIYVALLFVAYDLYRFAKMPAEQTGVGHVAHLGGAAFGFLAFRFGDRLAALARGGGGRRDRPREKADMELVELQFQVDALLDKVRLEGLTSLTEPERRFLREASERLGRPLT